MFRTLLISMFLTSTAIADTWTVDDDGKADFDNIQAAVDASTDGDEIVVMPGTYTGTGDQVVDMKGKAVWLHSSDGQDVTIIDGETIRRVLLCESGEDIDTIIEGFTIANGSASPASDAGGMWNHETSPKVVNCRFTNNTGTHGGAVRNHVGSPTFEDCTFENNTAVNGGGMYNNDGNASLTLTNCIFKNNTAKANGGGMWNYQSNPTLENCTFEGNTANDNGGGMYNYNSSSPTLTDTTVCGNTPDQIYGPYTDGGDNTNTIADVCISDTDGDGIPDSVDNCYLPNPDQADCNGNGIGDICDIDAQTSLDCDQNTVPDECDLDCNENGIPDWCDINIYNTSADFNSNGIPDECEVDCNGNGVPDDTDIEYGLSQDCNENSIPDECDLANSGQVPEGAVQWTFEEGGNGHWYYAVNANTPVTWNEASDLADALGGYLATPVYEHENVWIISTFLDDESLWGNGNGYSYGPHLGGWQNPDSPDYSEPDGGWEWITGEPFSYTNWKNLDDCCGGQDRLQYFRNNQNNGIWDYGWEDVHQNISDSLFHSYIVEFASFDCNDDGFIDSCQIEDDPSLDCDANGILDSCDLMTDPSIDCNSDGAIDSCQIDDDPSLDCNDNAILDSCELDNQSPGGAVQWPIEIGGNGHWYKFIETNQDWDHHQKYAKSQGAYLVTIQSEEEMHFVDSVRESVGSTGAYLIGGHQDTNDPEYTEPNGGWKWVTDELFAYTNWASGQPDDDGGWGNANLVGVMSNSEYWHDVNDSTEWYAIIEYYYAEDCNSNGILDECDIADGTSMDQDNDGIPDECEVDCNSNSVPDHWEIKTGVAQDCNDNGIPDECDIADGTSSDVNSNGVPDECEPDCNGNGIPDAWDIETGAAIDCNGNGIPDSCDATSCVFDCNLNGVPDECDIASGTSDDINANSIPDDCECAEDLSGDGVVGVDDLLLVIGYWGSPGPLGDFNADGTVGVADLLILISRWGECSNTECGPLEGPCCLADLSCQIMSAGSCATAEGTYGGDNLTCGDVNNCQPIPGACCFYGDACLDNLTDVECGAFGGTFAGEDTLCADRACVPPEPDGCTFQWCDDDTELDIGVGGGTFVIGVPMSFTDCDTLTTVNVQWGTVPDGTAAYIVISQDPNGDGDPLDAIVLSCTPVVVKNSAGEWVSYEITPTDVTAGTVHVSCSMVTTGADYPMCLDNTSGSAENSWTGFGFSDVCDPWSDNGATYGVIDDLAATLAGNWMIGTPPQQP